MGNSFLRWAGGYLEVSVSGQMPERFINMCANKKVSLWNLKCRAEGLTFYMKAADFKKIRSVAAKTKTRVKVLRKVGLPFFVHENSARKFLLVGVLFAVFTVYAMSFFIWDISFEGNVHYTDEMLLKFMNVNGYHPLMLKNKVTCEELETLIRMNYNDITWVSARIDGERLVVAVNENNVSVDDKKSSDNEAPVNIISEYDGIIEEIITRSGTPLVRPGSSVLKGDVLVSSEIDITNDNGEVVNAHFVRADSDIMIKTVVSYSDFQPIILSERVYTGNTRKSYYLVFGASIFKMPHLKAGYEMYDEIDSQKQLCVGNSLLLPVRFGQKTEQEYEINEYLADEETAKMLLNERLESYIEKIIKKGIQIVDKNVKIERSDTSYIMSGSLTVIAPAGKVCPVDMSDYDIENETPKENN